MNSEIANQGADFECPYQELIPYGEVDAPYFFGREDWCQIIINNLLASHLTLLYGASGVGKSSVLYAGVANRLKQQARESLTTNGAPEWAVIICRDWRDDPLATLRKRISTELEALIGRPLAEEKECGAGLSSLLQAASQAIGRVGGDGSRSPGKLLLILDQFEEYFLYHPQESGAGSFAEEFPQAVNDSRLSLNVLISLREDSLAKLDRFKQQLPDLFANRLQIEHLDRAAAIDAIRKPIEEFNRRLPPDSHKASVEPALIKDVLDQVKVGQIQTSEDDVSADQPAHPHPAESETLRVETPFLQLVMTRLWEEESRLQTPPRLRQETLQRLGGAGTIVREHLERLMEGLPESSKRVAAVIFDKLVTSGLTKIAYPVFELTDPAKVDRPQDLVNRPELQELLDHLSSGSQRILRRLPPALDQPKGEARYEIFHDVLAKPILEWRRGYRDRAEREEERQQHAQELRRERQRRIRNLWISAGIGLPLLGYTIFLGYLNVQLRLLNKQLTTRMHELTIIESAQQFKGQQLDQIDALVQAMEAGHQLRQAWGKRTPGSATYIAANLRHILDNIKEVDKVDLLTQEDASARLIRFNHDGSSVGIVFQDNHFELRHLPGKPINAAFPQRSSTPAQTEADKILSFAFARSGAKLATVSSDGVIRIWDRLGKQTHAFASTGLAEVVPIRLRNRLHFSPDGQRLAVIDQERGKGVLRVFHLGGSPSRLAAERFGEASDPATPSLALVRFSPAGNLLATATENGEVRLFDAFTGRALPSPSTAGPALWIASMEFSEDGQALAASSPDGVRLWQRDSQGRWNASLLPALNTSQLRFSKDGHLLATGSLDGWVRIWDARRPKVQTPLAAFLNQAPVQDVRFKPDGRNLLTVSTAGLLHEWEGPKLPDLETSGRRVRLSAAAFSPDGHWLAEANLGERSVCLQPLPLNTPGTVDKASSRVGGCTGTALPVPTTQNAPNVVIARLGMNPQANVVGLPWRGSFLVWNQQGRIQPLKLAKPAPPPPFSEISFSPDGRQFAVVARGGEQPQALLCPVQLSKPDAQCVSVGISADPQQRMAPGLTSVRFLPKSGTKLLFSTTEGQICSGNLVLNAPQVRALQCQDLVKRRGSWWQLSVSPDGSTIGLAGFDGTLYLFRKRSGDRLEALPKQPIKASAGPLSTVSFSPDGRVIAVVALNGTASLWDQAGRQLASFSNEESGGVGYMNAAFTSDGSKVRLVTKQGDLHVKDVEDLPSLLERGCKMLKQFLDHPPRNESPNSRNTIRRRLSFCQR